MQLLFFSALIFSSLYSFSQTTFESSIKGINQLNSRSSKMGRHCCDQENDIDENDLMQACAIQLCGSPKENPTGVLMDHNFDQYVDDKLMVGFAKVEKKIGSLIKRDILNTKRLLEALDLVFAKGGLKFDLNSWSRALYENYANKFFNEYIEFEGDKTKELAARLSYKTNFPDNFPSELKAGVEEFAQGIKKEIENSFTVSLAYELYTKKEANIRLKSEWDKIYKNYLNKKKLDPSSVDSLSGNVGQIQQLLKKNEELDLSTISKVAGAIDFMSEVLEDSWREKSQKYSCLEKCQKVVQWQMQQENFKKYYDGLKNEMLDESLIYKKQMAFCRSQYASYGLKDNDQSKFNEMLKFTKPEFVKNVFAKYSSVSKDRFAKYLEQEINFSIKSEGGNVKDFVERINSYYDSLQYPPDSYRTSKPRELLDELLYFRDFYTDEMNPTGRFSACNGGFSGTIWDAFIEKENFFLSPFAGMNDDLDTAKDNILVSKFSCTHENHGKGVLAHELGHALSRMFGRKELSNESSERYLATRKCVAGSYREPIGIPIGFEMLGDYSNDTYRTEEDMADFISYIAIPDKGTLFECSLLEPSFEGDSYNKPHLVNQFEADTHSSSLLRAMREAIYKGVGLPSTCLEVIDKYKDKFNFSRCNIEAVKVEKLKEVKLKPLSSERSN